MARLWVLMAHSERATWTTKNIMRALQLLGSRFYFLIFLDTFHDKIFQNF